MAKKAESQNWMRAIFAALVSVCVLTVVSCYHTGGTLAAQEVRVERNASDIQSIHEKLDKILEKVHTHATP